MTWEDGFIRVARDKEIGAECYRVLFVILASIEDGYFSPITPARISRVLNAEPSNVKRAIRVLVEKKVVKKRHASGKLVGFEIVEYFGG